MNDFSKIKEFYYYYLFPYVKYFKDERSTKINLPFAKRLKLFLKGFMSDKYFIYRLEENNYKDFISDIERFRMRYLNMNHQYIIKDKAVFSSFIKNYLPSPDCYAIIKNGKFYPLNVSRNINSFDSFIELLKEKKLIFKPNHGSGGQGIILLAYQEEHKAIKNYNEIIDLDELKRFLYNLYNYIVVEYIEQANYAKRIFPYSANTIRILTYKDETMKSSEIFLARHRFGTLRSFPADNISQGGISAAIHLDDGELQAGFIFDRYNGLIKTEIHPDTKEYLRGVKISNWTKIKEDILKAHNALSYFFKILGWDILPTEDGFTVIECNIAPDMMFAADVKIFEDKNFSEFLFRNKICKRR